MAQAGLNDSMIPVQIIQLDLYHIHFGVFPEDLVEHCGTVVKGKTGGPNTALAF